MISDDYIKPSSSTLSAIIICSVKSFDIFYQRTAVMHTLAYCNNKCTGHMKVDPK